MNIALTRVNFRSPADSKFVVRMGIDRHNCFGTSCKDANAQMLSAVTAWANAAAPTLTKPTALTATGTMVAEPQVLFWIQADEASVPAADQEFMQYTGEPARGRARRRQGRRQGRAELHVGRKLAPTDRQLHSVGSARCVEGGPARIFSSRYRRVSTYRYTLHVCTPRVRNSSPRIFSAL